MSLPFAIELGLTENEYQAILDKLQRVPTETEIGIFSVMWSEHCSYKNSILQLKTLPRSGARMLVEAGEENAGLVDIGDGYAIAFKIESHNHPSAIEPFQGAATGVGGILRDIFTMGARPIAALNSLRFGEIQGDSKSVSRTKFLLKGVVSGIGHYGNCFGVPTVGGEIFFDSCYTDNPLVNAMAVGIVKVGETASATAEGLGNPVMILGSATGRDGIHGASMASKEFAGDPENMRPTVQVGDPFSEKLLLEASLELIQSGCVVGMQDMGAAGICCSTSEMSAKGNCGMKIDLDLVPLRESGMSAYEIMLSESQERMLVVVKKGQEVIAQEICDKWDVPINCIGEVTSDGNVQVWRHGVKQADLPAEFLVLGGGAPVYSREAKQPDYLSQTSTADIPNETDKTTLGEIFWQLLGSPTIASKRWVFEQYDSQVCTNTVSTSGDAAVLRLKELPGKGIALTTDCNSRYAFLDPYRGGAIAVAEAARNVVCTGATPVAITNCLNFGNPYDPEVFYQFKEVIRGMGDACRMLDTPVTGGNVSFHNESQRHAIFPTPTIGMLGLFDDISKRVGSGFVIEGDRVIVLGELREELGGSEYCKLVVGKVTGRAPDIDLEEEKRLQATVLELIRTNVINSAHDCSEGGLAIALAEMAIASETNCGCEIAISLERASQLFGESQSRIIVTCSPDSLGALKTIAEGNSIRVNEVGTTRQGAFQLGDVIKSSINDLVDCYENSLPSLLES